MFLIEMMNSDNELFLNLFLENFQLLTEDKVFNVRFVAA